MAYIRENIQRLEDVYCRYQQRSEEIQNLIDTNAIVQNNISSLQKLKVLKPHITDLV